MIRSTYLDALTRRPAPAPPAEAIFYRTKDGRWDFKFSFVAEYGEIAIYCLEHPPLDGRDPDAHKTHLLAGGKICFVAGRAPQNRQRAEELAKQWAEYFLEYRRTGVAQK